MRGRIQRPLFKIKASEKLVPDGDVKFQQVLTKAKEEWENEIGFESGRLEEAGQSLSCIRNGRYRKARRLLFAFNRQ
jgi:hypothetical protein